MNSPSLIPRYNQPIPHMRARASSGLRFAWLTSFVLAAVFLPFSLSASPLADTARQLAHKIAAASGPGAFALEVTNHSSLATKRHAKCAARSKRNCRRRRASRQSRAGDGNCRGRPFRQPARICLVRRDRGRLRRKESRAGRLAPIIDGKAFRSGLPITLKKTLLFAQEQPMLDVALVKYPVDLV